MPSQGMSIAHGPWRSQLPLFAGLVAVIGASWFYLVRMNTGMEAMAMPAMAPGLLDQLATAFIMWSVMMMAMMLPTMVPALTVFGNLACRRAATLGSTASTAMFVMGYFVVWIGYAAIAALAQVILARVALLTPMLESASLALSAGILLAVGAFQFTTLKDRCLAKCRSPFAFFLAEWRNGKSGALALGLKYGSSCVGCCGALMAVMFVVGAMNLFWMGALTLFVLGEKLAPARWRFRALAGVGLVAWGLAIALSLAR